MKRYILKYNVKYLQEYFLKFVCRYFYILGAWGMTFRTKQTVTLSLQIEAEALRKVKHNIKGQVRKEMQLTIL